MPSNPAGINIGSEQVGIGASSGAAEGFFVVEVPFCSEPGVTSHTPLWSVTPDPDR